MNNFNSHAHVERDNYVKKIMDKVGNFNSHAHVERDFTVAVERNYKNISTHTLTWSVTPASLL